MTPLQIEIIQALYANEDRQSVPAIAHKLPNGGRFTDISDACVDLMNSGLLLRCRTKSSVSKHKVAAFQLTKDFRASMDAIVPTPHNGAEEQGDSADSNDRVMKE